MAKKNIYWTIKTIDGKTFLFAATQAGLCYVNSHEEPFLPFKKWCQKNMPTYNLIEDGSHFSTFVDELEQYFSGKTQSFNSSLDLYGTQFQISVWKALQTISYGNVISYSDVAEKLGKPTAVRAVGTAIGANPILIFIPCHRVIGKDGTLTGFRAGLDMKKRLLSLEKVEV